MHILLLSDNFPPEVNAPASRGFEHAQEWVGAGHRVTVITCAPNFPRGELYPGYANRWRSEEQMAGIHVIRVWSYVAPNSGRVRRILDYLSYMMTAFWAALWVRRVDVIVATSPQFFTAVAGGLAALVKRTPWVFELRDLWPESIAAVGALRKGPLLWLIEKLELLLYRKARTVVAVSPAFQDNLVRRGVAPEKIHIITNGVDLSRFRPVEKPADLQNTLGLSDAFVAGYIGTHGLAHGLDCLLDAAAILRTDDPACRLLMLGEGADKARLRVRAHNMGLDNIIFADTVPKDQVPRYWALLDAAIVHLHNRETFAGVIPSKLFEAMAIGVPVIHAVPGVSAALVKQCGCGLIIPPEDPAALAAAIQVLRSDPARRAEMRAAALAAAPRYDRHTLAAEMLRILQGISP